MRLTDGKGGDDYDIILVLANSEENSALVKCRQLKSSCLVPSIFQVCRQMSLILEK